MQIEVIRKTQETLGTVIKKPPLNEKLLNKPPFRFLHDIITEVIRKTGFMKGLYTESEMVSENVKDKESKIAFLQKALDVTSMVMGELLAAKPTKIVAGHEPEKTNQFLQALAKGVLTKKDTAEAVERVLAGEKPSKKDIKTVNNQQKTKESVSNKITKTKSDKEKKVVKTKIDKTEVLHVPVEIEEKREGSAKENESKEPVVEEPPPNTSPKQNQISEVFPEPDLVTASPEKMAEPQPEIQEPLVLEQEPERPATSNRPSASSRKSTARPSRDSSARRTPSTAPITQPEPKESPKVPSLTRSIRPTTTRPTTARPMTSRPITARPTTARPAPPRILNKNIVAVEETRAPSAKAVASVILDDGKDDEDEGFVVDDNIDSNDLIAEITATTVPKSTSVDISEEEQKGSLVKQMLVTKKDLEGGSQQKKTEIDKSQMSDDGKRKERETSGKELEQLRQFIQTVSRSANPLGKMLDYLQEDIDAMNQELRTWHEEHQQNLVALKREENVTESVLDPLGRQLEELEQTVADQLDKISALKATIFHNDERIQRMLSRAHNPV